MEKVRQYQKLFTAGRLRNIAVKNRSSLLNAQTITTIL